MFTFIFTDRLGLWDELPSILTIIICPAMHLRNFTFPVSMSWPDRCCPFQCIRTPWIRACYFSSFEDRIEEIEYEHQLHRKYYNRNDRDHFIQVVELGE